MGLGLVPHLCGREAQLRPSECLRGLSEGHHPVPVRVEVGEQLVDLQAWYTRMMSSATSVHGAYRHSSVLVTCRSAARRELYKVRSTERCHEP